MNYRIFPSGEFIEATVDVPLSKSVSARALIMQAVSRGNVNPGAIAECRDTDVISAALSREPRGEVDVCDSGTALRFLTAYFAATEGADIVITGSDRLCERPISHLVDALQSLGADIEYTVTPGHAPLHICGRRLQGGGVAIDATVSSQYASALLLIAPAMTGGLTLSLDGEAVSQSYIRLTMAMMHQAGIECEIRPEGIVVPPGRYTGCTLDAEADWSAATFWYEAVAVTGGFITVKGLTPHSAQPDSAASAIFGRLGVTTDCDDTPGSALLSGSPDVAPRLNIDLNDNPDMAPAIAVACALIGVPFKLTGLSTLPSKECDRIAALASELTKIGIDTEVTPHSIAWAGRRMPVLEMPVFDTHGDHRMAMAFAFVAAYIPGVVIRDADVVAKSYPAFWEQLERCGFTITDADVPLPEATYSPQTTEET